MLRASLVPVSFVAVLLSGCSEPTSPMASDAGSGTVAEAETAGSTQGSGETSEKRDGNLPCDGCAGDPCGENADCLSGFFCARIDANTAWCTNCTALGDCNQLCQADVNCGEAGVCHGERCWHGCSSGDDCPDGYECVNNGGSMFCAPSGLPELDDECIDSVAGWCESFVNGNGTCVFIGEDPQSASESWCSKTCTQDTDCTDVWPLGCCSDPSVFSNGNQYCLRPDYADACDPPPCGPGCDYCWEGSCDTSWNGDGSCDCGCQFVDVDC